jgi:hypothetical protein
MLRTLRTLRTIGLEPNERIGARSVLAAAHSPA